MKTENWYIKDGQLFCDYETWKGRKKTQAFTLFSKGEDKIHGPTYSFKIEGTVYRLNRVHYDNLVKCYIPGYNNTHFTAFIHADLTQL